MDKSRITKNIYVDENGCWIWLKSCNSAGYGQLTENKKYWLAHRYAYTCFVNELKDVDILRHMCHKPRCCNPEHLLVGTHKDNWQDSREVHLEASKSLRGLWSIDGKTYSTLREAQKCTGIHHQTIMKYTENGVFNIDGYRAGCKISHCVPKV